MDDKKIREFNLRYLGIARPTDVLSFDLTDSRKSKTIFADIVISAETAISNSKIFKTTPLFELQLYVVHSLLHLLGYDDRTKAQRKIMQQKSSQILNNLKIK